MKKIFSALLVCFSPYLYAQNNPIFFGGVGDGWRMTSSTSSYTHPAAKGGSGDGFNKSSSLSTYTNPANKGGSGDGWKFVSSIVSYTYPAVKGGSGDGWNARNTTPSYSFPAMHGGVGDGWAASYTPMGPLPVSLVSFEASKEEQRTRLEWVTSMELNSSHYVIERSRDAVSFEFLAHKPSENKQQGTSYKAWDTRPWSGYTYYRIKMVDIDGKFKYTPTRHVIFEYPETEQWVKVFPNPSSGPVYLEFSMMPEGQDLILNVTNNFGQVVYQDRMNPKLRRSYDFSFLPKGVYYLQLHGTEKDFIQKLVLQ